MSDLVESLRTLVVDDFDPQRSMLRQALEMHGLSDIAEARDAAQFFERVRDFDPEVILTDRHLGRESVVDVLGGIRTDATGRARLLIVMTGDVDDELRASLEVAGAHLLEKPFRLEALYRLIDDFAASRENATGPTSSEILIDVVRSLADAKSIDDVTTVVRTAARALVGADGATFVLRDGDLCHYVDEDAIAPLWKGQRFSMSTCISGWAMQHSQMAAIEDIYVDDRIPHDAYRPTFVRSLVMTPVRTKDPIAAIGVYWAQHHVASPEECQVLQALADSAAVALSNVLLVEQARESVERASALETQRDSLREFVYAVAHDVRSPLATIRGYADLLLLDGVLANPGAQQAAAGIRASSEHLSDFVDDLLAFAVADGHTMHTEMLQMRSVMADVIDRLRHPIVARAAHVVLGRDSDFVADKRLIAQLMQNLVANAINYTPPERQPRVVVEVAPVVTGWEIAVSDNGAGVDPDERESIFEPFRRGRSGLRTPGTGLGLAMCRRVAERHGGSIRVDDGPDGGARFVVQLTSF